ncbi:MAG: archease [Bacillota bacterium]|jgi:SHS2 domain-containing protein
MGVYLLDRGADLRLKSTGGSLAEALAHLVLGMYALMVKGPVKPVQEWVAEASGPRCLAVPDLLNEVLFLYETEGAIASCVDIRLGEEGISAVLAGETFQQHRHLAIRNIKAATYQDVIATDTSVEVTLDV